MKGVINIILELFEPPDGGPFSKFFMGYLAPGLITVYAIYAMIIGETIIPLKGLPTAPGLAGCLLALMYVGVAALLHFHWGWGLSHQLWHYSVRAKLAALGFMMLCIFALIVFLASYHPDFPFFL